jgi:hypothetical protein
MNCEETVAAYRTYLAYVKHFPQTRGFGTPSTASLKIVGVMVTC